MANELGSYFSARREQLLADVRELVELESPSLNGPAAALPGFTLPGDVSASARYFTEDVIDPPVTVSEQGTIAAPCRAEIPL